MEYTLTTPPPRETLKKLKAGDTVLLSGEIYTARDAAHAKITEILEKGGELPFPIKDAVIYYAGPTPAPEGCATGSIGPTTAGRMDAYTPRLLDLGLAAMIGKGTRSAEVMAAIKRNGAVYFGFIGGAGALAAACVTKSTVAAFPTLASEAVHRLTVKNFPLTVIADSHGGCLYTSGPAEYLAHNAKTLANGT